MNCIDSGRGKLNGPAIVADRRPALIFFKDNMPNSFHRNLVVVLAAIAFIQIAGCGGSRRSGVQGSSAGIKRELDKNVNFIQSAFSYTLDTQRFDDEGFKARMVENLNGWIRSLANTEGWQRDPMVDLLPQEFGSMPSVQGLADLDFRTSDADYFQEAVWLKSVADRVASRNSKGCFQYLISSAFKGLPVEEIQKILNSDDQLRGALAIHHGELSDDDVEYLAWSCRLFDWTVRNIQLDAMPVIYNRDEVMARATEMVDVPSGDAASDGVEGPGYTRSPGRVLTHGKGDLFQKSRVFILLCRQVGIEAVQLYVVDRNDPQKRQHWAVGVLLGEELFLFDMMMGLPIPSLDYRRIATLAAVQKDSTVLTQLRYKLSESVDANPDYRIRPDQLRDVSVSLDASVESLSRRMALLEPRLLGDYKVKLAYQPSRVKSRLEGLGLKKVDLSEIPFDNQQYEETFKEALQREKEIALRRNYRNNQYFEIKIPIKKSVRKDRVDESSQSLSNKQVESVEITVYLLSEARHRFLLGVFGADMTRGLDTLGVRKLKDDIDAGKVTLDAGKMFLDLTIDDDRISEILTDKEWAEIMGLGVESNLDAAKQAGYKDIFETALELIRTDASIWLALTNFETGDFGNARNWFGQIDRFDNLRKWTSSSAYNLARSHEALSDFSKAIELLRSTESEQKFGNIIRARLIQLWNLGDSSAIESD
jgi:hypothetical protein